MLVMTLPLGIELTARGSMLVEPVLWPALAPVNTDGKPSGLLLAPVPFCTVTLKFAELKVNQSNQRVFGVKLENATVLPGFDIWAAAGRRYTAVDRPFTTIVTDGVLNIGFAPGIGAPVVNGIEVGQR